MRVLKIQSPGHSPLCHRASSHCALFRCARKSCLFSSRWRQERTSTAAVIAAQLTRFKACYKVDPISAETFSCMAPLTSMTWNMPRNTYSQHPSADWKEPRLRMDGPLYKFQVCWGTFFIFILWWLGERNVLSRQKVVTWRLGGHYSLSTLFSCSEQNL